MKGLHEVLLAPARGDSSHLSLFIATVCVFSLYLFILGAPFFSLGRRVGGSREELGREKFMGRRRVVAPRWGEILLFQV